MSEKARIPATVTLSGIVLLVACGIAVLAWVRAAGEVDDFRRERNRLRARAEEAERRLERTRRDHRATRLEADRLHLRPRREELDALREEVTSLAADSAAHRVELEGNAETIERLRSELESTRELLREARSREGAPPGDVAAGSETESEPEPEPKTPRAGADTEGDLDLATSRVRALEAELRETQERARAAEQRAEAARVPAAAPAGAVIATRLREELRTLLRRGGAVAAITARLGDSEITRDLLEEFLDDEELASRALLAVAGLECVETDRLVAYIAAGSAASDQAACEALARAIGDGPQADERLARLAAHDAPAVRRACARVAAAHGDRAGAELLLSLAGDPDDGVAELAASSLAGPELMRLAIPPAVAGLASGRFRDAASVARALLHPSLAERTIPLLADAALDSPQLDRILGALVDSEDVPPELATVAACGALLPLGWASSAGDAPAWSRRLARLARIEVVGGDAAVRAALIGDARVAAAAARAIMAAPPGDDDALVATADAIADGGAAADLAGAIGELEDAGASPRLVARTLVRASADAARADVAALALARHRDPRTTSVLLDLLDRVEPGVAIDCAAAAARLGHPAGTRRLADVVLRDGLHRASALQRLAELDTSASWAAARGALEVDDAESAVLLVDLADRAGRKLEAADIDLLLERHALRDGAARRVLAHAERVLGDGTRARLGELLLAGRIRSKAPVIRYLGTPPDPKLLPLFTSQLSDPESDVRVAAVTVIGRAGARAALAPLLRLVNDPDPRVRRTLANVIADVRDPACRGALVALSKDFEWYVREAAVAALPEQDDGRLIIPALKGRLSDEVMEVRNAALMALCRTGVSDHVAELFDDLEVEHLAGRTRAFLERTFRRELPDAAAWRSWWETHGRIEFEERRR